MAELAYQVTDFAYQGSGAFAYQGSEDGPSPSPETIGYGNWGKSLRGKKLKSTKRIYRSDYVDQEEFAAAVKAALRPVPMSDISDAQIIIAEPDDGDDDDLILQAVLLRILH